MTAPSVTDVGSDRPKQPRMSLRASVVYDRRTRLDYMAPDRHVGAKTLSCSRFSALDDGSSLLDSAVWRDRVRTGAGSLRPARHARVRCALRLANERPCTRRNPPNQGILTDSSNCATAKIASVPRMRQTVLGLIDRPKAAAARLAKSEVDRRLSGDLVWLTVSQATALTIARSWGE
jgi:hypothetical protein